MGVPTLASLYTTMGTPLAVWYIASKQGETYEGSDVLITDADPHALPLQNDARRS
jgi:hypothetical protein